MIIIIAGPLGVGKTTIAKNVAQRLGGLYLSIDQVLSAHSLDTIPEGSYCIPLGNFLQANRLLLPAIGDAIAQNKDVVLDGCFYHIQAYHDLLRIVQGHCKAFTLHASLETCIQRDKQRERTLGADAARAVYKLTSNLTLGEGLDAEKPIVQNVEKILHAVASKE